jgi:hypothetical protein
VEILGPELLRIRNDVDARAKKDENENKSENGYIHEGLNESGEPSEPSRQETIDLWYNRY